MIKHHVATIISILTIVGMLYAGAVVVYDWHYANFATAEKVQVVERRLAFAYIEIQITAIETKLIDLEDVKDSRGLNAFQERRYKNLVESLARLQAEREKIVGISQAAKNE